MEQGVMTTLPTKIIVTGPQRSGTRFVAKVIAHDANLTYIDETEIHTDSLYALWSMLDTRDNVVIQCPALSIYVHLFGDRDDVGVVMVIRDPDAIQASQDETNWTETLETLERARCGYPEMPSWATKYVYWKKQKRRIKHYREVVFEELQNHELWKGAADDSVAQE